MPVFTGLPVEVLTAIWDWLPFYTLLRLMAVSRLCRDVTMAHPCYWQILKFDITRLSGAALEGATRLFFLRLERAGSRPVVITLRGPDPRGVLRRILPHMTHVGGLALVGLDQRYSQEVVNMLDTPAPLFNVLAVFGAAGAAPFPLIGQRLFDSSAPCLRRIVLYNICLPTPFPAVFNNLSSLLFVIESGPVQQLPYGLGSRLSRLTVSGNVEFAPEYFDRPIGRNILDLRVLCRGAPAASRYPWHAWRELPRLSASGASLESCLALLDHFPGPLFLRAITSSCRTEAIFDLFRLKPAKATILRSRRLVCAVPTSPEDPNIPRDSAVYPAIVARADRIAKLELRPVDWDPIVSLVKSLPSLGLLRILLSDGNSLSACSAVLETPKLQWLCLDVARRKRLTQAIPASVLRSFLDGPLRHAPPPRRIQYGPRVTVVPSEDAQALSKAAHR